MASVGLQECSSQLARRQEEIQTQGRPLRNGYQEDWGQSCDGNSGREQMGNREAGWESGLLSLLRMLPLTASQDPRAMGSSGTSPAALASPWQLPAGSAVECMAQVLFALGHTRPSAAQQESECDTHTSQSSLTFPDTALLASTCFSLGHTLSPVPVCSRPQEREKHQHIGKIWDERRRDLVGVCPGMVRGAHKRFLLEGEQAG